MKINKKLIEDWKTRKNLLPSYVSPSLEINEEENRNKLENEEVKKEKMEALLKIKKAYSSQVHGGKTQNKAGKGQKRMGRIQGSF